MINVPPEPDVSGNDGADVEVDISELGPLSLKSTENIEISSMCSVFAESEVISLIARNKETSDIAHGIHMAIAAKSHFTNAPCWTGTKVYDDWWCCKKSGRG